MALPYRYHFVGSTCHTGSNYEQTGNEDRSILWSLLCQKTLCAAINHPCPRYLFLYAIIHVYWDAFRCINSSPSSAAYVHQWTGSTLDQVLGLSPVRRQAITWTNADLLSIRPLGTNFSEILIEIQNFSFTKIHLKVSSVKWWPFCSWVNPFVSVCRHR